MLCTTHIEIHIAPVFINVLVNQGILVLRIHIAQIVGTGSSKTWHGVQLQGEDGLVVDELFRYYCIVLCIPSPNLGASQWGFTSFRGFVLINLRQFQRKALLRNHIRHLVLVINRERLSPVTLTREDGITQTIVHLDTTQALFGNELLCGCDSFLYRKTIQTELRTC